MDDRRRLRGPCRLGDPVSRAPATCRRAGCDAPRLRRQIVCEGCWRDIPAELRQRYLRAARAGLTRIKATIGREILRTLGRRPAPAPATSGATAYARTCALLGERED